MVVKRIIPAIALIVCLNILMITTKIGLFGALLISAFAAAATLFVMGVYKGK
jgi:hypothetical protein